MPLPTFASPRHCQPLAAHESPPPVISDPDSTPKMLPIRQRILADHSDPPSIRSDTLDAIGCSRSDAEIGVAVSDLRHSSSSTRIVFNSFSSLDSDGSLPSLIRSQHTSGSTSSNPSLCGGCGKGSTPVVKEADRTTEAIDGSRNPGAYVDHENWMNSSIELGEADARKAITAMKGRKQSRHPAALSPTTEADSATETSIMEKVEMAGPRRSLPRSGRKRSVSINTPPEPPRKGLLQMELRPLATPMVARQQQQLPLLPMNKLHRLQEDQHELVMAAQQHLIEKPHMPACAILPTPLPLRDSSPAPADRSLHSVLLTVAESSASGIALPSTASCKMDHPPLSSTCEESGSALSAALKKRILALCGGGTKRVVSKRSV
ncbi:hypothetical protein LSCM1_01518 [Leishmania martiniquensis]|uniref:Uncharacterized protein n=1 Tax=Leishmania martiniquensis TaxID=1580590 RepID=A0A836H6R2_9TRYP|nr:hypothetical protein LSCM1_01518 [Leishmania martiniquensis]